MAVAVELLPEVSESEQTLNFLHPGPADVKFQYFITRPIPIETHRDRTTGLWYASYRYSPVTLTAQKKQEQFEFDDFGEPMERPEPEVEQFEHIREVHATGSGRIAAHFALKQELINEYLLVCLYSRGIQAEQPLIVAMRNELNSFLVRLP